MTLDRGRDGRQRILHGAAQILDAGVLADFTVDTLARNLRMSKSTLYKYFESKDQVIVALLQRVCADTERRLSGLDPDAFDTAYAALAALADVLGDHADRVPGAILLDLASLSPDLRDRVLPTRQAVREHAERILVRGVRNGEFEVTNPRLLAAVYVAALEEAMQVATRRFVDLTRGDAVRTVHDVIALGLRGKRPA